MDRLYSLIDKASIEQPDHDHHYVPVLEWYEKLEETAQDLGEYNYVVVLRYTIETNRGWMNARILYALYNH
jgi:hypothetical protein